MTIQNHTQCYHAATSHNRTHHVLNTQTSNLDHKTQTAAQEIFPYLYPTREDFARLERRISLRLEEISKNRRLLTVTNFVKNSLILNLALLFAFKAIDLIFKITEKHKH